MNKKDSSAQIGICGFARREINECNNADAYLGGTDIMRFRRKSEDSNI